MVKSEEIRGINGMTIVKCLKVLMRKAGLSQDDFAKLYGVSKQNMSRKFTSDTFSISEFCWLVENVFDGEVLVRGKDEKEYKISYWINEKNRKKPIEPERLLEIREKVSDGEAEKIEENKKEHLTFELDVEEEVAAEVDKVTKAEKVVKVAPIEPVAPVEEIPMEIDLEDEEDITEEEMEELEQVIDDWDGLL